MNLNLTDQLWSLVERDVRFMNVEKCINNRMIDIHTHEQFKIHDKNNPEKYSKTAKYPVPHGPFYI